MIPRVAWVCLLVACASPTDPDLSVEQSGPHAVGTTRIMVASASQVRSMQVWYPTTTPTATVDIAMLESEPLRSKYAALLASSGTCATHTLDVAIDGEPEPGPFPFIVGSHCHSCTRLSNASTAVRLASHGFVVVTVDHIGDTLWDDLDGHPASLDAAELEVRRADIAYAIDLDSPILASADRANLGVFGHSFGAVTAGRVAQTDDRVRAAAALASPMENPLIPGVLISEISAPLMFLVAVEDNSITEFGNKFIRDNFAAATGPAWKQEVADAGHWSVSDLDGLIPAFAPGCGTANRQTDGEPFTYLDPATGRDIAAAYTTAFFRATLLDDAGARAYLDRGFPDDNGDAIVTVAHRN